MLDRCGRVDVLANTVGHWVRHPWGSAAGRCPPWPAEYELDLVKELLETRR